MNRIVKNFINRLIVLTVVMALAIPLFSQHIMICDSINHNKEFIIKKGYKVLIKGANGSEIVKYKVDRCDDTCLYVHKGEDSFLISLKDISYLSYKPNQKSVVVVWAVSAGIAGGITLYLWNLAGDSDEGEGAAKALLILSAPLFVGILPVLISQIVNASLPRKSFFIGHNSSLHYVKDKK